MAISPAPLFILVNNNIALVIQAWLYSQLQNLTPLSVSLVLDPFGGSGFGSALLSQDIVAQIVASVQPGDTATGK